MSLSMPLPNCNKSLLVDALLLGEPSGSSGGEDPSGMQCLTLTNCGITLMAFAAPAQVVCVRMYMCKYSRQAHKPPAVVSTAIHLLQQ